MFKRIATAGLIPALIVSTVLLVAFIAPAGAAGINTVAGCGVGYSTGVPGIRSVSPTHGTTAGGTSVAITGIHFVGATSVVFGGSSAAFTVNSDSSITATSPLHSAGTVNVHVTNPCGTSATTTVDRYTFTPSTVNACTSASLSASPVSFALEGATVTLTASSTGCPNPEYMFFLATPGSSKFRAVTGFDGATFAWNTTGALDGVWGIGVWVRQIGSGVSHQAYYIGSYKILANCIAAQLNASPASPQARGTVVTLQAFSTVCSHPRYRFFILTRHGTHWSSFGAFSSSSSVNWNTAGYAAGPWRLLLEARQLGSIHSYDTYQVITFYVS